MVRIQQRQAKRAYMKGKNIYQYDRRNVALLKKFHSATDAFLNQDLDEQVSVQNGALVIILTPKVTR